MMNALEAEREEEPPKKEEEEEEEGREGGTWMVSKSPRTVLEALGGPGAGKEEGGREDEGGCCVSKSRMTVWETGGPRDTGPEATNIGWTVSNNE